MTIDAVAEPVMLLTGSIFQPLWLPGLVHLWRLAGCPQFWLVMFRAGEVGGRKCRGDRWTGCRQR